MTDATALAELDYRPLTDDRDIERLVNVLLERPSVARTWIMLLDDQLRSTRVIIPIDDLPNDPQAPAAMPSGGPVSAARVLGDRIAQIVDQTPAASVVVIWERPGVPGTDPHLIRWVEGMREGFSRNPLALRAQLVLTDEGARILGGSASSRVA